MMISISVVVFAGRRAVGWRGRRGMVLGRTQGGDIGDPFAM